MTFYFPVFYPTVMSIIFLNYISRISNNCVDKKKLLIRVKNKLEFLEDVNDEKKKSSNDP